MGPDDPVSDLVVLGAGPAGLVAAWRAALAGHHVTLCERSPAVGGMTASTEVVGVRVDLGSHRLHPSTPLPLLDALRGLLGADLQVRPRHGRIRLGGRWLGFPLRATDLLTGLPPRMAAAAARDAVTGPLRRERADTFAEVVRAGLGSTVADAFYAPYVRKIWGVEASQLAGELARRRVSASSPTDIVHRLVRGARRGGRTFLYPRGGFGRIAERLADAAVAAGVDLRLGTGAVAVQLREGSVGVEVADGGHVEAERVFTTVPVADLAAMAEPAPPDHVLTAAAGLEHRGVVLVYLALDRPRWTEYDAHYFPDADVALARLSEPKNYRDDPDDPGDRTVLCAEIPCSVGDGTWTATPEELGARVAGALARLDLPDATPSAVEVRRLPRVYPLYRPGFAWDLSVVDLWLADHPRLVTFGRQGLFVPDNTHHALAMGWAAAETLGPVGGPGWDQRAWDSARTSFRRFVVED